jgi:hypothetical protein
MPKKRYAWVFLLLAGDSLWARGISYQGGLFGFVSMRRLKVEKV